MSIPTTSPICGQRLARRAGSSATWYGRGVDVVTNVTITSPGPIPVGGISQADGDAVATRNGAASTVDMRVVLVDKVAQQVIAQTKTEELGLLGSKYYINDLSANDPDALLDISMYLNLDMIGSPNAGYFVYDGNDSDAEGAGAGPYGSAQIEQTFVDFFNDRLQVQTEGTDFDGRSDYGPFIAVGIPSGGLFTGAEGTKTPDQVALWGGTAGLAYDPCYHLKCDNLGNVDRVALGRNLDAAAWATGIYGYSTEDINGVPARDKRAQLRAQSQRMSLLAAPDTHDHGAAAA